MREKVGLKVTRNEWTLLDKKFHSLFDFFSMSAERPLSNELIYPFAAPIFTLHLYE